VHGEGEVDTGWLLLVMSSHTIYTITPISDRVEMDVMESVFSVKFGINGRPLRLHSHASVDFRFAYAVRLPAHARPCCA
jgi:hypothetical protein